MKLPLPVGPATKLLPGNSVNQAAILSQKESLIWLRAWGLERIPMSLLSTLPFMKHS